MQFFFHKENKVKVTYTRDKYFHIVKDMVISSVPFQSTFLCSHLALQNYSNFKQTWLIKTKSTQWCVSS